jgi:hypothetical protein
MASSISWLLVMAGVLLGALLGGIGALIALRRGQRDPTSVRSLERELESYRRDVADHYVETAKRVDALTHAYKAVYDHLEDGAVQLVGEAELRARLDRLEDTGHEPVTLEGIGQRVLQDVPSDPDRAAPGHDVSRASGGDSAGSASTSESTDDSEGDPEDVADEVQRRA